MIGSIIREVLPESQEVFLVPAESVADAMYHHPSSHGSLILSKIGCSKISVLGKDDHLVGLINSSDVVNKIIDLQAISMNSLEGLAVTNATKADVPMTSEDWELEEVLHLLVDSPPLPVVAEERIFKGIIAGKELLKAVDFMVHELERRSILSPEIEKLKEQIDIVS